MAQQGPPEYLCLIDEEHIVADLFAMANVPMAVWIDEDGRIVRPTENPGHSDYFRRRDPETFLPPAEDAAVMVSDRRTYFAALRDWVAHGAESEYALSPEQARRRIRVPGADDVLAAVHARVGRQLFTQGQWQAAKRPVLQPNGTTGIKTETEVSDRRRATLPRWVSLSGTRREAFLAKYERLLLASEAPSARYRPIVDTGPHVPSRRRVD